MRALNVMCITLLIGVLITACEEPHGSQLIADRAEQISLHWAPKLEAATGHLTKLKLRADRLRDHVEEARDLEASLARTSAEVEEAKAALATLTLNVRAGASVSKLRELEEECEHVEALARAVVGALDAELQAARGKLFALETAVAQAWTETQGQTYRNTLHTGFVVSGIPTGVEQQLLEFIEGDTDATTSPWWLLDRLFFEADSPEVDLTVSSSQLENLTHILKAYGAFTLSIGSYTPEYEEIYPELRQQRVESVINQLVAHGVDSTRLRPSSRVPERLPCPASDDATICRALNRRIAVQAIYE